MGTAHVVGAAARREAVDVLDPAERSHLMSAASTDLRPVVDGRGATTLGRRDVAIERQHPDVLIAPVTDAGTVPNLKFPYALAHNRVLSGGWAREIMTRELPIATEVADVSLAQWMGVLPPELVKAHLNLDDAVIAALPRTKPIAVRQAS
jgi:hypothetical protein